MKDVAPQLIEQVNSTFAKGYKDSKTVSRLMSKLEKGNATYEDAYRFAVEIGNIRAKAFKQITGTALPDGTMYYNIADRLIRGTLPDDYKKVSTYATSVQSSLNKKSKINLKAQQSTLSEDRIKGFIDRLSNGELFDDISWILDEPVKVFTQNGVDETIKKNADFQSRAGVEVELVRTSEANCCSWCTEMAGEYTAPFNAEIFGRHDNCRCTIEYKNKRLNASGNAFHRW